MSWPTDPTGEWYLFEGEVKIPVDASRGVAHLILRPQGGMLVGVPPIAQGEPGAPAEIDTSVDFTELDADDPTPAEMYWTKVEPNKYKLVAKLHSGPKGEDGTGLISPSDFDQSPVAGYVLAVAAGGSSFELVPSPRVEVFYPGSISSVSSGNPNATLCGIAIPSRPYARRVFAFGHAVVAGEGADVRVALRARLGDAMAGNVVASCPGVAQTDRLVLSPGKPIDAGTAADSYDQVGAGSSSTLYVRTERTAGTSTYTVSASSCQFMAVVVPA